MIRSLSIITIALALGLTACARSTSPEPDPAHTSTISDPQTGVELRVTLDRTEINAAGRIRVDASVAWPDGVSIQRIDPRPAPADPEQDGPRSPPTLERVSQTPIAADGGRFSRTTTYEITPDLPGRFVLEDMGVRIDAPGAPRRILRLAPIAFEIVSVLADDDDGTLDPALGYREPRTPSYARIERIIIAVSVAAALVGAALVLILRRTGARPGADDADPRRRIERALSGDDPEDRMLDDESLAIIHRAAAELDDAALVGAIESMRYGGAPARRDRIEPLTRDTAGPRGGDA